MPDSRSLMACRLVSLLVVGLCAACNGQGAYPLLDKIDLDDSPDSRSHTAEAIRGLAWSPSQDMLATASDYGVYLYSVSGQHLDKLSNDSDTGALAWSPNGQKLAGATYGMWVWDTDSHQFTSLPGGSHIQFGSPYWSDNATVSLIWDLTTGQTLPLALVGITNPVISARSPDGRYLVVQEYDQQDAVPRVIEADTNKVVFIFPTPTSTWGGWNATGTKFATQESAGDIVIWDTDTWQPITTLPSQGHAFSVREWSPTGDYLAISGKRGVILWNTITGSYKIVHDQEVYSGLSWDPSGTRLASAIDDTVYIWDVSKLP